MHTIRLVFFALALLMTSAQAAECERPARLHFSLVPQSDLQKDVASLKPLFADLQAALGIPVEVVMPTSYGAVIEDLLSKLSLLVTRVIAPPAPVPLLSTEICAVFFNAREPVVILISPAIPVPPT